MPSKLISRNPVAWFLALAFAWAWGFWIPVLGTDMSDLSRVNPLFFVFAMLGGFGPTVAGTVVRLLLPRDARPKLLAKPGPRLFLLAGTIVPVATLLSLGLNRALGLPYDPGRVLERLPIGLTWPLFSSMGEEFGWRGFLLPRLWRDGKIWKASVTIGLLWGFWHLPADWIGMRYLGWYFIPQFILIGLVNLTLLSVIMTAIVHRGRGDIRLAILFHYSITSSAILLLPQGRHDPVATVLSTAVTLIALAAVGGAAMAYLNRAAGRIGGRP